MVKAAVVMSAFLISRGVEPLLGPLHNDNGAAAQGHTISQQELPRNVVLFPLSIKNH